MGKECAPVKYSVPGKSAFYLHLIALLLLQPFPITLLSPSRHYEEKALRHPCGCSVAEAASGACGCAERGCCTCCAPDPQEKNIPACHQSPKDSSAKHIRLAPCCGEQGVFTNNPSEIKFILSDFKVALVLNLTHFAAHIYQNPEGFSPQPAVPPPEVLAFLLVSLT